MANGIWKKALKTAVSGIGGVIISNLIDPANGTSIYTLFFWKHLAFVCFVTGLFMEARYWKEWADKSEGGNDGNNGSSSNP